MLFRCQNNKIYFSLLSLYTFYDESDVKSLLAEARLTFHGYIDLVDISQPQFTINSLSFRRKPCNAILVCFPYAIHNDVQGTEGCLKFIVNLELHYVLATNHTPSFFHKIILIFLQVLYNNYINNALLFGRSTCKFLQLCIVNKLKIAVT
jgi:hypothetical protein